MAFQMLLVGVNVNAAEDEEDTGCPGDTTQGGPQGTS